ncbi:hypothetical protein K435DRAFT_858123 [Dendrothele bispora CBS 962.96]|uniref:C2H2-type domain-containing protein n=1 Tax=Dendrothele bispora (strain CBS 962.96) TaxID=1314807 RepID=A0A4S8M3W1_DENBC|nr:hypothetical protein K435DRAFT_858123 [Dendrothele bispora CBS 962.96]
MVKANSTDEVSGPQPSRFRATPPPRSNQSSSQSNGKKESTSSKKKAIEKKKSGSSGVWPCKMNGCNKQFAREADLKRHQRTTKVHSMPGFACPQCDATFTRTDALRRHQKSRHNGVVIEPMDQDKKDSDEGQSSRSSSEEPSSKGKEPATTSSLAQTVQGKPSTSGPATGHTSYYHQRTGNMSPYVPTRLTAAQWSNAHQWPDGQAPPPMGSMAVFYIPATAPSPYYRNDNTSVASPPPASASSSRTHASSQATDDNASRSSPETTPSARASPTPGSTSNSPRADKTHTDKKQKQTTSSIPNPPPAIDPSLGRSGSPEASPSPTNEQMEQFKQVLSMDITQNGFRRVLDSANARGGSVEPNAHSAEKENTKSIPETPPVEERTKTGLKPSIPEHGYGSPMERPQPMEHMLTEDGEPMLNPGLTVSSAALSV